MTLTLRPDQVAVELAVRDALKANQGVLVQCATGWGKTALASTIGLGAHRKGKRTVFLVHRTELLRQTSLTFDKVDLPHGFIAAGMPSNPLALTQIASADTLRNRLAVFPADLLVVDEAHLYAAPSRQAIIDYYRASGARIIALTATPERLDGKPLRGIVEVMVRGPSVAALMDLGILSRYRAYAPTDIDLSEVAERGGDYDVGELDALLDKPHIIGDAAKVWKQHAAGKRTIVFCFSRDHGKRVAALYGEAGIPSVYLDGETPKDARQALIAQFADRKAMCLINIQLCTEGFDLSAQVGREVPIEAAQFLRPTKSLSLAMQMMGRALRRKPEPAILLDHANLFKDHGFPDDPRDWTLDGRKKKKKAKDEDEDPPTKTATCSKCYTIFRAGPDKCPHCGAALEKHGRFVEEIDGELSEIDPDLMRAARELNARLHDRQAEERACKTLGDWQALARKRGYKSGWAFHRFKAKENV